MVGEAVLVLDRLLILLSCLSRLPAPRPARTKRRRLVERVPHADRYRISYDIEDG